VMVRARSRPQTHRRHRSSRPGRIVCLVPGHGETADLIPLGIKPR